MYHNFFISYEDWLKYFDLDWSLLAQEAILKIMGATPQKHELVIDYIQKNFPHIAVTSSEVNLIDIFNGACDKYHCILYIMKELNANVNEVIFFGDNNNDYLALKEFPISVCVGQSNPELIAAAKFSTSSANHDGVLQFLNKYFP